MPQQSPAGAERQTAPQWQDASQFSAAAGWQDAATFTPAAAPAPVAAPKEPNTAGNLASHVWQGVNPFQLLKILPIPEALGGAGMTAPWEAAKGVAKASIAVKRKGDEEWAKGNHADAIVHYVNTFPFLGPMIDAAAEHLASGELTAGVGDAVGIGLSMAGPKIVKDVAGVKAPQFGPTKAPANPAIANAIAFGERSGIPIDAATATDNSFVRGAQKAAENVTLSGAKIGQRAAAKTTAALTTTGEGLADRLAPAAATPETAGAGVRSAVENLVRKHHQTATNAYEDLRTIEQQRGLTVNVFEAKSQLMPLYEQLKREAELIPLQGGKATALVALDRLMSGPDTAPLSVVDAALGDLKSMARGADMPELRTPGQRTAAGAVSQLDRVVRDAAMKGGPDALDALEIGRDATKAKYQVAEILDAIHEEPVRAFGRLTSAKDSQIGHLRAVEQIAPREVATIGRAWFESLMDKATAEGGFQHADKLWADWNKVGPETKRILFGRATADINDFLLLSKKLAVNPNPSGSAYVGGLIMHGAQGWILHNPITAITTELTGATVAALAHSPQAMRALTQGVRLSMPAARASKALQVTAYANILKTARAAGVDLAIPATEADPNRPAGPPAGTP